MGMARPIRLVLVLHGRLNAPYLSPINPHHQASVPVSVRALDQVPGRLVSGLGSVSTRGSRFSTGSRAAQASRSLGPVSTTSNVVRRPKVRALRCREEVAGRLSA